MKLRKRYFLLGWLVAMLIVGSIIQFSAEATPSVQAPDFDPEFLDIGMSDSPQRPPLFTAPDGIRYRQQYLSGGAGTGWTSWNDNGDFPKFYIQESQKMGKTAILTFYNICQSGHGGAGNGNHPCYSDEQNTIANNLSNAGIMRQYWADLELFYRKAAEFPAETVILHVEPDMWGHAQLMSSNNTAAGYSRPIMVGGSGHPALSGLPNTLQGFAQALFQLRSAAGANNVLIAYHVSTWGTRSDFVYADPNSAELNGLADKSIQFYRSLNRPFDLTFFEMRDRDAQFYAVHYGLPNAWWQENDFDNHIAWIGRYTDQTGQKVMIWQIPYGNTKRAEVNNTWGHYQDNLVETLLDEQNLSTLFGYKDAGVVALIFGQGAAGTTCPCDSNNDGRVDDGGYFYAVATDYLNNKIISLDGLTVRHLLRVDGIRLTWGNQGADGYEVWWGDSAALEPGVSCASAENCTTTAGLSFEDTLPSGVDERFYLVVMRQNGADAQVSPVFRSVRLTESTYLPAIVR